MSAVAFVERAEGWARQLESGEAQRAGLDRAEDARPIVARRLGVAPGTLTSLRKRRLKSISAFVYHKLQQAVINELQLELSRLSHELEIAQQQGLGPRDNEVSAIVADIQNVKTALGLDASNDGGAP